MPPSMLGFSGGFMMSVTPVRSPTDFQAALPRRPAPQELSVVSFVKHDCRACKYAAVQFRKMAREFEQFAVKFYEMDVADRRTSALCRDLGVAAVPAFHIYGFSDDGVDRGVGCLDEVVGPSNVGRVKQRITEFSSKDFDMGQFAFVQ